MIEIHSPVSVFATAVRSARVEHLGLLLFVLSLCLSGVNTRLNKILFYSSSQSFFLNTDWKLDLNVLMIVAAVKSLEE